MKANIFAIVALGAALAACASPPPQKTYAEATAGTQKYAAATVEICVQSNDIKSVQLVRSSGNAKIDAYSVDQAAKMRVEGPNGCRNIDIEYRARE